MFRHMDFTQAGRGFASRMGFDPRSFGHGGPGRGERGGHCAHGRTDRHEGHGRHGFGGPWDRGERGERGFGGFGGGGGRERLFEGGDLKLVILNLLAEQPSYGYQIIKRLEEQMAGAYTPSAGVVYPTLTLLEEEGLTAGATAEGKKVYTVTDSGQQFLMESGPRLKEIHERLKHSEGAFQRGRSPQIMQAFMELRSAVKAKAVRGNLTKEQIAKMAEEIAKAAAAIDKL